MPITPPHKRQRQEDYYKFEASLVYLHSKFQAIQVYIAKILSLHYIL